MLARHWRLHWSFAADFVKNAEQRKFERWYCLCCFIFARHGLIFLSFIENPDTHARGPTYSTLGTRIKISHNNRIAYWMSFSCMRKKKKKNSHRRHRYFIIMISVGMFGGKIKFSAGEKTWRTKKRNPIISALIWDKTTAFFALALLVPLSFCWIPRGQVLQRRVSFAHLFPRFV